MPRKPYRRVLTGVDTLEVTAKGPLYPGVAESLDAIQQTAIEERDERREHKRRRKEVRLEIGMEIAGQPLLIAPFGVRQGMYQWTMSCPALTVDMGLGKFNGITAEMRLSSSFLWEQGYRHAWDLTKALMGQFGDFTYQASEIHLCVDMAGVDVGKLHRQHFVGRSHVTRWHEEDALVVNVVERKGKGTERPISEVVTRYREQETLRFSPRSAMSGTVYNKLREIRYQSQDKQWFLDLWRKNGWDGLTPVARVEMRPERAVLHEMHIETPEQAFDELDPIWAYAAHKWMRHTMPTKDKQRSRWPTSPWWREVQGATFERVDAIPAQREKVRSFRRAQILGMILGYLETWTAWNAASDGDVPDISVVLREIANEADTHYLQRDTDFVSEVIEKRRKIGFAS